MEPGQGGREVLRVRPPLRPALRRRPPDPQRVCLRAQGSLTRGRYYGVIIRALREICEGRAGLRWLELSGTCLQNLSPVVLPGEIPRQDHHCPQGCDAALSATKTALVEMGREHRWDVRLGHQAHTTVGCAPCGARTKHALPLWERTHACNSCGAESRRDENSAPRCWSGLVSPRLVLIT